MLLIELMLELEKELLLQEDEPLLHDEDDMLDIEDDDEDVWIVGNERTEDELEELDRIEDRLLIDDIEPTTNCSVSFRSSPLVSDKPETVTRQRSPEERFLSRVRFTVLPPVARTESTSTSPLQVTR
jgi:hypothetical protein